MEKKIINTIIAMWSGPRNISTAMMRSFGNRPDTVVEDEPFYANYLLRTGTDHPMRDEIIASQEHDWSSISNRLNGEIPKGRTVWYQKHMAQHLQPYLIETEWTKQITNCFLIRHPREVILSYQDKFEITSADQLGFIQQLKLFDMLIHETDQLPVVINAKDILMDPACVILHICILLDIPFYESMLSWPAGPRKSDGVWGKHWYKNVEASTGFNEYEEKTGEIPPNLQNIYEECLDAYTEINRYKINAK